MLVKTFASAVTGVEARTITIEVNTGGSVATEKRFYSMVGLPDKSCQESFERIEATVKNLGFKMLRLKTLINMAPADIRKEGTAYDLPIALGILAATKQITVMDEDKFIIMGELSLDGGLRPIKGALPITLQAKKEGFTGIILPLQNSREAAIVQGIDVYGVETLLDAIAILEGTYDQEPIKFDLEEAFNLSLNNFSVNFSDVKGQENIKRAMELSAAGGHNLILIGPPGAGKTMLARRLSTILPPLSLMEALETTKIHSVAGALGSDQALITDRPFRSPHHTISDVALVGGGSNPNPGEISLAHNGVLFLDELPEFKRAVLEVLRQPMEQRRITISRAKVCVDYPASFMLVASMNPCPCGYYNHPEKECVCGPGIVKKYLNKISGPLLDRIDLHVEVTPVSYDELSDYKTIQESSEDISNRVLMAREIQRLRFECMPGLHSNAQMPENLVKKVCQLDSSCKTLLKTAMEKLQLSARAYDRILKVARTAADLAKSDDIKVEHISEAIQYRSLDREGWAG